MAKRERGRAEARRPRCPRTGHGENDVVLAGRVIDDHGTVTHQRYICGLGTKAAHGFRVRITPRSKPRKLNTGPDRPIVPPPACPEHDGGTVVRYGGYGTSPIRRQRYRCTPPLWKPGAKRAKDRERARHVFTPDLPRVHVTGDDACPHCAELRAINHGETIAGRKHTADTARVAEALRRLSAGETYAEVSLWLHEELHPEPADLPAKQRRKTRKKKDAWRRAADLVELFAPVLWSDWQRQVAEAEVKLDMPRRRRVIMLDDIPLFANTEGRSRQVQRFAVLTCGEVVPSSKKDQKGELKLRLMRAYPTHNANAYKLVLDELGFVPNYVVADSGKGIRPAVMDFARKKGKRIRFITSHYHLQLQLGRALDKAVRALPTFNADALRAELNSFSPFQSRAAFRSWWTRFEGALDSRRAPKAARSDKWKREYYDLVCEELKLTTRAKALPRSTGALETLVGRMFKSTLEARSHALGNLARTNALLDLFVLRANGYFNNMPHVIQVLREDAVRGDPENPGFVPPVRQICDHGLYRSLLDPEVVERLAVARGLA